jgi:hypothetical protein
MDHDADDDGDDDDATCTFHTQIRASFPAESAVPHYHHFQYKALSFSGTVNWTK